MRAVIIIHPGPVVRMKLAFASYGDTIEGAIKQGLNDLARATRVNTAYPLIETIGGEFKYTNKSVPNWRGPEPGILLVGRVDINGRLHDATVAVFPQ